MQALLLADKPHQVEPWFSSSLRSRLHGKTVDVDLPRRLRRVLHVPEMVNVSTHAEKHRIVTGVDSSPGPWRPDLVPHAAKVMDTYGLPWVEEVWFCAVERAAKTNIMLNCMQWAIDCDPGNIFALSPTELDSGKLVSKKIIPMLQASLRLARYLSPRMDDLAKTLISLNHGMSIFPAHANSASTMAAFYGKHCFAEEVDKYPHRTGREASPIALIRKRGRDKRGSKRMFSSTPAQQFIWKGVNECHQIWEYELCCPSCGDHYIPKQEHIVIGAGATVESVERGDVIVELACPCCGHAMNEADRAAAYNWGRWKATKGADLLRPAKVGFHLPAWGLPSVPLVEIAVAILRAATGDVGAKIALANGYAAEDYKEETKERQEDTILALCDDRPAGEVHIDTDILTMHVDTQDAGFWYTIRGWRYDKNITSWLVKAGYVPSANFADFSALDRLIFDSEYRDALGRTYQISYGIIDAMGHRTSEVYEWCKRSGFFASQGASRRKSMPVTVGKQEVFPGTNKQIPGGLNLYTLDTHFHKDMLVNKLSTDPTDPGAWVLHSGVHTLQLGSLALDPSLKLPHALEVYAKHFCAEYRDEKGLWQCPEGKANHLFDCEQMAIALANYLGFANMISDKNPTAPSPVSKEQQTHSSDTSRPGWFHSRPRR
jgi:phage terminase large subunit GpA-like protein